MTGHRKKSLIHQVISKRFSVISDKPCWNVRQGHGSSITFEFGQPSLKIYPVIGTPPRRTTDVRGEWHLWIWCCHWTIVLKDKISAHSESSRTEIARALAGLQGQVITSVLVDPLTGKSLFEFDLGGSVRTWPYDDCDSKGEPYDSWMLFEENDHLVLTYFSNGKYRYGPSDSSETNFLNL